jgi:hypothetical protein
MLTPARIARLAQTQDWQTLLREVLANGRPLPTAAAERLAEPSCVKAAAASLGLCRVLELTRTGARVPTGSDRSPTQAGAIRPLVDAIRESSRSSDPVARAFALAALAAINPPVPEERAGVGDFPGQRGGKGGALSGEGSPLDALLIVWALGGVFVCSPSTLAERSDLRGLYDAAARDLRSLDHRTALASDLRSMLALASIALRRSVALRHAA